MRVYTHATICDIKSKVIGIPKYSVQVDITLSARAFSNKYVRDCSVTSEASSIRYACTRNIFIWKRHQDTPSSEYCNIPLAFYCSRHGETVLFKWPFVETTLYRRWNCWNSFLIRIWL